MLLHFYIDWKNIHHNNKEFCKILQWWFMWDHKSTLLFPFVYGVYGYDISDLNKEGILNS